MSQRYNCKCPGSGPFMCNGHCPELSAWSNGSSSQFQVLSFKKDHVGMWQGVVSQLRKQNQSTDRQPLETESIPMFNLVIHCTLYIVVLSLPQQEPQFPFCSDSQCPLYDVRMPDWVYRMGMTNRNVPVLAHFHKIFINMSQTKQKLLAVATQPLYLYHVLLAHFLTFLY